MMQRDFVMGLQREKERAKVMGLVKVITRQMEI